MLAACAIARRRPRRSPGPARSSAAASCPRSSPTSWTCRAEALDDPLQELVDHVLLDAARHPRASSTSAISCCATRSTAASRSATGAGSTPGPASSGRGSRASRRSTRRPTSSAPASARRRSRRPWPGRARRRACRPIARRSTSIGGPSPTCRATSRPRNAPRSSRRRLTRPPPSRRTRIADELGARRRAGGVPCRRRGRRRRSRSSRLECSSVAAAGPLGVDGARSRPVRRARRLSGPARAGGRAGAASAWTWRVVATLDPSRARRRARAVRGRSRTRGSPRSATTESARWRDWKDALIDVLEGQVRGGSRPDRRRSRTKPSDAGQESTGVTAYRDAAVAALLAMDYPTATGCSPAASAMPTRSSSRICAHLMQRDFGAGRLGGGRWAEATRASRPGDRRPRLPAWRRARTLDARLCRDGPRRPRGGRGKLAHGLAFGIASESIELHPPAAVGSGRGRAPGRRTGPGDPRCARTRWIGRGGRRAAPARAVRRHRRPCVPGRRPARRRRGLAGGLRRTCSRHFAAVAGPRWSTDVVLSR